MEDRELVDRLLKQNERLIDALMLNQPVEVIRALNPPVAAQPPSVPWDSDAGPDDSRDDLWGDQDIPTEDLLKLGTGWVGETDESESPA